MAHASASEAVLVLFSADYLCLRDIVTLCCVSKGWRALRSSECVVNSPTFSGLCDLDPFWRGLYDENPWLCLDVAYKLAFLLFFHPKYDMRFFLRHTDDYARRISAQLDYNDIAAHWYEKPRKARKKPLRFAPHQRVRLRTRDAFYNQYEWIILPIQDILFHGNRVALALPLSDHFLYTPRVIYYKDAQLTGRQELICDVCERVFPHSIPSPKDLLRKDYTRIRALVENARGNRVCSK